jgi:hypothetical protein
MMRSLLALIIPSIALTACVPRSYEVDPQFGEAVRESRSMQIVNPEGIPPSGYQGLDGAAANAVMDRYVRTFQAPPPPVNVMNIGVGTAGAGTMTTPGTATGNP